MNSKLPLSLATVGAVLALASPASADYASTVGSTAGLSSYWRLGEASGTRAVDVKGVRHGTLLGGVQLGQAPAPLNTTNTSAGFNGTGAAVSLGDTMDFSNRAAFSFEGWVRPATAGAASTWRRLVSKEASDTARSGYAVLIAPDSAPVDRRQRVVFERRSSSGTDVSAGTTALKAAAWHHVAVTYDGGTMRVYVNGRLEGSKSSSRSLPNTSAPLRLGTTSRGISPYAGLLDDVAVYSRALSGATVQSHHAAGVTAASAPTATPVPTATPAPTAAPTPTATPAPVQEPSIIQAAGPRPVDRTPTGTVRYVSSGQSWVTAINASSSGDTVIVNAGSYSAQTISTAMGADQNVNVFAAPGATVEVAGLDLTDAKGLTFKGFRTGSVYMRRSERLVLQGNDIRTAAGVIGIDIRDSSTDIAVRDNTYPGGYMFVNLQAAGESTRPTNIRIENNDSGPVSRDHIFISRARYVWIQRNRIRGITDTTEHTDGVQSVGGQDLYIRRNHFSDTRAMRDGASDRNDHAIMLNSEPSTSRFTQNVEISNNLIHDWVGTGIAVAGGPGLAVFNNTIYDLGRYGTGAAALVMDADTGNTVSGVVYNNVFSSVWMGAATLTRNEANFVADGSGPAGVNRLTGDPGFRDRAAGDFGLLPASRSNNSASSAQAPTNDLFGATRRATPDRGAIELVD